MALLKNEKTQFKAILLLRGLTIKEFCLQHSLNYESFRVSFAGRQAMTAAAENAVRKELYKSGKLVDFKPRQEKEVRMPAVKTTASWQKTVTAGDRTCGMVMMVFGSPGNGGGGELSAETKTRMERAAQEMMAAFLEGMGKEGEET